MNCNYCGEGKIIFYKKYIHEISFWLWEDKKIDRSECIYDEDVVFIDRGYLRIADKKDNQCLDHGDKIKINYCPFCGKEVISCQTE